MTIFAVMAKEPTSELEGTIARVYPKEKNYRLTDRTWLLSDTATAREVSEKLGVRKGGITGVVVMGTTSAYYGVANTSLWDWLRARIEADGDD